MTIDAGLPSGAHRFRLEVVGTSGLRSQPAEVVVVVASATAHGSTLGDADLRVSPDHASGRVRND